MTYLQALQSGYRNADQQYQRGYVSRKVDVDTQWVYTAGGSRKGDKYVLLPAWNTTQFCIRQYIAQ